MDEVDVSIILALADHNMNITEAARVVYMHRNAVLYRLRKIERETGLDPTVFYDLCKLVDMVEERRG